MSVLDWLAREGGLIVSWWLLATLAGIAALPWCARLLGGLPDRGYTLARTAGLLLVGFAFWLLASFGFLRNTTGDMLLAWALVLLLGVFIYFRFGSPVDWRAWWRENRSVVIAGEVLFIVLFLGWSVVRAHQNGLTGTEKPMELMFMNSVARSETFPPHDGWMAGYAISYYYFGYVISAMLSMLSGINAATGFNLMIALLFALTGSATFGVVYNLVRSRAFSREGSAAEDAPTRSTALLVGLLGAVFVVLLGNFQTPLLEIPYQTNTASADYLRFWDVDERQTVIDESGVGGGFDPASWDFWWWFRAARVLNDLDLNGGHIEVIDEFPQFSFLLADVHPHVLALPFVMLAIGMALNLLLTGRAPSRAEIVFYAVCIGGLAFLNTWDGPVYLIALVGADALRRLMQQRGRLHVDDWIGLVGFGGSLLVLAILLYLPFWLGFRSQASGLLPNIINPTRTQQLFLMFGPFLLLLPPLLLLEVWRGGRRMNWKLAATSLGSFLLVLLVLMAVLIGAAAYSPALRNEALNFIESAGGWDALLPTILSRRAEAALTLILLLAGIFVVLARLFPRPVASAEVDAQGEDGRTADSPVTYSPATGFALLLVGIGLVLTLVPEFVYLRDNFGTRMNTIFKFYYQAWLVFGVASAYAVYTIILDWQGRGASVELRALYGMVTVLVLVLGLTYPIAGVYTRMFVETGRFDSVDAIPLTLDGGRSFVSLDDYQAIMCLAQIVRDDETIVAEAVGPAYRSQYGRVAALAGIPIVLGWENHQRQWRGATYNEIAGTRAADIATLYTDVRWDAAQTILARYGIDYVFFGQSERLDYGLAGEDKFRENLEVVCEFGSSRFYRVLPEVLVVAQ
jgi:YYY domain-containing protein